MTPPTAPPTQDLDFLFPLPSPPPSALSPSATPGITRKSAETLVRLLKENHVKYHCFFNDRRFHNHLSHHLLAAYHMGGTPELLHAAFDLHASYQRLAYKSPSSIDAKNWKEHLGDEDYYNSYLEFFSAELIKHGVELTLEKFFFSNDVNWGNRDQDLHPHMISRLLAGLVHPFIYLGHGLEFGQLGMAAEGLAQAAVHTVPTSELISRELLEPSSPSVSLAKSLARTLIFAPPAPSESLHPFSILARILKDPRLGPEKLGEDNQRYFPDTMKHRGHIVREYAEKWDVDASTPAAVSRRVEEIAWVVALLYGVGGCRKDRPFKADFFSMHLVTSSLFLPSLLPHLSIDSKSKFLRSYFAVILGYWVSQGRAKLDIENFYASTTSNPVAPSLHPHPNPETLVKGNPTPNPWYPLMQSTLMHPGEHLLKLERAFAHYACLYGATPMCQFKDTELNGSEKLDGTLFLRAAWLSLNRNGWMREGDEKGDWDFDGFFDE